MSFFICPMLPDGIYGPGSMGCEVSMIQNALLHIGYCIEVNGIYENITKELIESIQMKFPEIKSDGIYNHDTKKFMLRLLDINYQIVQNPDSLMVLVNKFNSLPKYVPKDLKVPDIPFSFEEMLPKKYMRMTAAKALEQLFCKAKEDNINLAGVSGYRSYERQAEIFADNYNKSPEEAVKFSARPGESEHQTGLAIDVSSPSVNYELEQVFGETDEGEWLKNNAADFGFIIRYQKGREHITGYQYEPWHIRYVGMPHARKITDLSLTLEEYLCR